MKNSAARKGKPRSPTFGLLELRIQRIEKTLNARIDLLRRELRASETALAAVRLRALNDGQTRDGADRLRADLQALHDAGIVDRQGRRIRRDWPASMNDPASDVV